MQQKDQDNENQYMNFEQYQSFQENYKESENLEYFQTLDKNVKKFQNQRKVILGSNGIKHSISLDIVKFSLLLEMNYSDQLENGFNNQPSQLKSENIQCNQTQKQVIQTVEADIFLDIPAEIQVSNKSVDVIETFMKFSDNKPSNVKLNKIKSGMGKDMQKYCDKNTNKFIQTSLQKLNKQQVKQLIQLCRYLQINSLLQVIYFHLACKYSCAYGKESSDQQLNNFKVKKLSNQEMTQMKRKYYDYFKKLTNRIQQIKDQKVQDKQRKIILEEFIKNKNQMNK